MIEIERVELSVGQIEELVEQGHRVRETPHLGGPHNGKYALTLGGLASDVLMVDTIRAARDRLGSVQNFAGQRIVSNKQAENSPAAAMRAVQLAPDNKGLLTVTAKSLKLDLAQYTTADGIDLTGIHLDCVAAAAAKNTTVTSFADFWRKQGEVSQAMMATMAQKQWLRRWFDADAGKIRDIPSSQELSILRTEGSYFDNADSAHGILPSVEALYAVEAVTAVVEGRELVYDHLDIMSSEYTQSTEFVERVQHIAQSTLASLGVRAADVAYRLIAYDLEWDEIGGQANHFEMICQNRRFDVGQLMSSWQGAETGTKNN